VRRRAAARKLTAAHESGVPSGEKQEKSSGHVVAFAL